MIIECLIKRVNGSQISIGDQSYDFQPNDSDNHICEVTDEAHIARLMEITEGYCEFTDAKPKAKK